MSLSMESMMETAQSTTMEFPRFGACTFGDADVIEFPWGLPGFPDLHRWLILSPPMARADRRITEQLRLAPEHRRRQDRPS